MSKLPATPGGRAIPNAGSYEPPVGPKGPAGNAKPTASNCGNNGTQNGK